jgi:hypothetical protein
VSKNIRSGNQSGFIYGPGKTPSWNLSVALCSPLSSATPICISRTGRSSIPTGASPLWKIAVETTERAAAAWKGLEQADLLPKDLRASIDKQILAVAATVK